jgi:ubiquinone/menaquinone biosynthesis C-methylase UbiE
MNDESIQKVRAQFGPTAGDYATSEVHARGESLEILLSMVRSKPHWKALDVATGAGHTAMAFAPHVRSVVATDITESMLAKTAELARSRGLTNVQTAIAEASELPFPGSEFDLVTCRLAFHHFPDQRQAASELARVLRPGGLLGFTDNITVEADAEAEYYNDYERLRDPSHHRVLPLSEFQSLFESVGLAIESTRTVSKELEFNEWADRQRVSSDDKSRLMRMMSEIPEALAPLFRPRTQGDTMFFSLWEAIIVARKRPG